MGVKEKNIINEIQLYFTTIGSRIFRNNTGQGWQGTIASKSKNSITLLNPRPIHSGLATGSSDLIGWTTKIITAEMVGQKVAVFTAIEVKTGSLKATSEQAAFIKAVLDGGGIAKIARSLDEIK
jgi:hypothetical protein